MIITGHMNYFDVNKCGLYRQNSSNSKGIDLAETFQLITQWVHGKALANTLPWNPQSGLARCYCKDIYTSEDTGDVLLVLWKSDTTSNGSILGAPEDAKTGEGNVVEYTNNYKGNKVIWGRPMYYWVIPSKRMVVSIKFENSVCDTQLFQDWVTACISNRVDHQNKKREYTESGQTRISFTDGTVGGEFRFRYQFDVSLRTEDTANATMTAFAASVTHIIKRETISITSPTDERAQWVRFFDGVPLIKPARNAKTRQIEVKVEAQPTVAELEQIIKSYTKENRKAGQWDNIGFATGDQIVWVDRYRLRNTIGYEVPKEQVITAVDLCEAINSRREHFLSPRLGNSQTVTVARTGTTA